MALATREVVHRKLSSISSVKRLLSVSKPSSLEEFALVFATEYSFVVHPELPCHKDLVHDTWRGARGEDTLTIANKTSRWLGRRMHVRMHPGGLQEGPGGLQEVVFSEVDLDTAVWLPLLGVPCSTTCFPASLLMRSWSFNL